MHRHGLAIMLAGLSAATGPAAATSPSGFSFLGVITSECSQKLADGRLYAEHRHRLRAGHPVGVNVRSADFAPRLEIWRAGSEAPALARVEGAADARASGIVLRPAEDGSYIFRVSSASPQGQGRYRLEVNPGDRIDRHFPGEDADLTRPYPGCAPLIMSGD